MRVNNGVFARQPGQQLGQSGGGLGVPRSLNRGGGARGIVENVVLIEADRLDAGLRQARIDGPAGAKEYRPCAG